MAKDRNTVAKRQREVEKRRKAEEKRSRRANRKNDPSDMNEPQEPSLTSKEHTVLAVFREYLMTPGKMLCLNSPQLETLSEPLEQLTEKGLLVAEQRHGGYSLTEAGYNTMTARN